MSIFKRKTHGVLVGKGYKIDKDTTLQGSDVTSLSIPDSSRKGHFWCFGTTRVGKTRLMENMIEQDIRSGKSIVVIDPKGDIDLFNKIVQTAMVTDRDKDELMLITPIFPEYSVKLDPLAYYYMPEELVGHIVSGVEAGKERFFYNVAYEVSLVIVQALIMIGAERETQFKRSFNLNDVKNIMSKDELKILSDQVKKIKTPEAQQLYMDMMKIVKSPTDYYAKVSSSLRVSLMEITSGNIGQIVGTAESNKFIERLEKGKRIILIVHLGSLITRKAAFTLGKVIVSMIQSFIGRVFSSGRKVDPPLSLYIDEAQNMLYHGIDDLFAKAGGADVWVHGFAQSISQLYASIGEDYANSILDNTNSKIYMRVPDTDTAKYCAGHFGHYTKYSSILGANGGVTVRELEDDTLKPEDILGLPERVFYMMTYSGFYKGRTFDISPTYLDTTFPNPEVRGKL